MNRILIGIIFFVGSGWNYFAFAANQNIPSGEERWVINGETAYDMAFDLTWQRCARGQRFFGGTCVGGARAVNVNGAKVFEKNGWRLPTVDELLSIVKYDAKPMIDERVFPGFACCYYWTSEIDLYGRSQNYVLFDRGELSYRDGSSSFHYIRLVRSGRL